jgi:hypothetical protein
MKLTVVESIADFEGGRHAPHEVRANVWLDSGLDDW